MANDVAFIVAVINVWFSARKRTTKRRCIVHHKNGGALPLSAPRSAERGWETRRRQAQTPHGGLLAEGRGGDRGGGGYKTATGECAILRWLAKMAMMLHMQAEQNCTAEERILQLGAAVRSRRAEKCAAAAR